MRIGRTLPPAAAPLSFVDIINGISGLFNKNKAMQFLQKSLCSYFNVQHCFLLSSGKAALTQSFKALSKLHPERHKVIIPAFNCYSVPSAIVRAGCTVVPCDINPDNLQFDLSKLHSILEDNASDILAICPTHLFGLPASVQQIKDLVKDDKDIAVIEDAAQAMGSSYKGKLLGTEGDIGIFSFARGKAVSAGEGGVIVTNNNKIAEELAEMMKTVPDYGLKSLIILIIQSIALTILIHPWLFWFPKMLPFLRLGETVYDPDFPINRFSGFQAGLARRWESKIDWLREERAFRVQQYLEKLKTEKNVTILADQLENRELSCIRFPVKVSTEEKVQDIISQSERIGLGIAMTYPDAIDSIPELSLNSKPKCLSAQDCAKKIITLPCHPLITKSDIEKITRLLT